MNEGLQLIKAGRIKIDGTLSVSDPSYSRDVWCRMNNVEVESGTYVCYLCLVDDDEWGERVSCIAIIHDTMPEWDGTLNNFPDQIGTIGVDSGMAGFFPDRKDKPDWNWHELLEEMSGRKWLLTEDAFFSDSGLGDGGYPVYRYDGEPGIAPGLLIRFL